GPGCWRRQEPGRSNRVAATLRRRAGLATRPALLTSVSDFRCAPLRLSWGSQLLHEVSHLDRGSGGLGALVARLTAGPVKGLFHGVGRDDAEDDGYARAFTGV